MGTCCNEVVRWEHAVNEVVRLDEIDRELQKSASSSRSKASSSSKASKPQALMKKHSSRSSQGAIDDLFDSDDEWVNEGLEGKEGSRRKGGNFNPRQDPSLDRWVLATLPPLGGNNMLSMRWSGGSILSMRWSGGNMLGVRWSGGITLGMRWSGGIRL